MEITGRLHFEIKVFPTLRVLQGKGFGVKGRALNPWRTDTIFVIPDQWQLEMGQVNPDLVSATRFQMCLHQTVSLPALDDFPMGDRGLAGIMGPCDPYLPMTFVGMEGKVAGSGIGRRGSLTDGQIAATEFVIQ